MLIKSHSIFLNVLFFVAFNISADHGFESCIQQRKTAPFGFYIHSLLPVHQNEHQLACMYTNMYVYM